MSTSAQPVFFSVVVPFLNEERWLRRSIQSLQAQTFDPSQVELIFVDNGSTDRSAEIVRAHPAITLLQESRRDPYLARNRGIAAARGRYIAFTDADCLAKPDWLATLRGEIGDREPEIVLGYVAFPQNVSGLVRAFEVYTDRKLAYLLEHRLEPYYFGNAGNMAVRADLFRELGPFPPMPVVGDTEIIHRVLAHAPGASVRYARSARVVHAEVETLGACLEKIYECGTYAETFRRVSRYQPVTFAHRLRILRHMLRAPNLAGAINAAAMLLLGWFWYAAGRIVRGLQHSSNQPKKPQLSGPERVYRDR